MPQWKAYKPEGSNGYYYVDRTDIRDFGSIVVFGTGEEGRLSPAAIASAIADALNGRYADFGDGPECKS